MDFLQMKRENMDKGGTFWLLINPDWRNIEAAGKWSKLGCGKSWVINFPTEIRAEITHDLPHPNFGHLPGASILG